MGLGVQMEEILHHLPQLQKVLESMGLRVVQDVVRSASFPMEEIWHSLGYLYEDFQKWGGGGGRGLLHLKILQVLPKP